MQNDNLIAENRRLRATVDLFEAGGGSRVDGVIPEGFQLRTYLAAQERLWYVRALDAAGGVAADAARLLGIDPAAFRARAASLGLRSRRRRGGGAAHDCLNAVLTGCVGSCATPTL